MDFINAYLTARGLEKLNSSYRGSIPTGSFSIILIKVCGSCISKEIKLALIYDKKQLEYQEGTIKQIEKFFEKAPSGPISGS